MKIDQKAVDDLKKIYYDLFNDRRKRLLMTSKSTFLFTLYYLGHYFKNPSAPFHQEMCQYLSDDDLYNVLFVMFRWSAKTSFVKWDFLRNIVFAKRKVMFWASANGQSAADNLFDIALNLQSNKRLIADFGELFYSK